MHTANIMHTILTIWILAPIITPQHTGRRARMIESYWWVTSCSNPKLESPCRPFSHALISAHLLSTSLHIRCHLLQHAKGCSLTASPSHMR